MATDADENDMLTYTLWWGDSSDNLSKTDITATGRSGQSVILEKSGLSNDTRYWLKVVVSDGIDEVASGEGNENTYCLGSIVLEEVIAIQLALDVVVLGKWIVLLVAVLMVILQVVQKLVQIATQDIQHAVA